MTCTFCGSLLDGTESECPYCGHKVNKGYDEEPVAPKKSRPTSNYSEDYREQYDETYYEDERQSSSRSKIPSFSGSRSSKNSGNPGMPLVIGMGALLILSLISLFVSISVNSKVSDLQQDMLSQLYQIQTTQNEINSNISNVGSSVGSIGSTISESNLSRNITITKQPSEASTYVGRGSDTDNIQNVCIFSISAEGQNLSFDWQKYDEVSGGWVTIAFDPDNNENYGLHLYSTETYSELCARDLKSLAFGSYRCMVSDGSGVQYSDIVTLTEKAQ